MTSLSEQLSAARQSQWEAQIDMFRALSTRALDSAGQLAALNLRASRASLEQATQALHQLVEARDPRDLFHLGSAAQGQWHTLFSYTRDLAGIAFGARAFAWSSQAPMQLLPAPTANIPTSYTQAMEQASIAAADVATISGELAAAAADTGAALAEAALDAGMRAAEAPAAPEVQASAAEAAIETAIETAIADEVPPARAKPVARAFNKLAPKPASAEHPIASTLPLQAGGEIELPVVAPTENVIQAATQVVKLPRASRKNKPTQ